jgi:TPR repeat protein
MQAVKWYMLAAEQGNSKAQSNLGIMYFSGQGVTQDYKQAVKWTLLAAEQGFVNAQFTLGLVYENGLGTPQDNVYGHMWYHIASSNGSINASEHRNGVESRMTKEEITKAQKLAKECLSQGYKGC